MLAGTMHAAGGRGMLAHAARCCANQLSVSRTLVTSTATSNASADTTAFTLKRPDRLFGLGASRSVLTTVDCHCAGLPARVVVAGTTTSPVWCCGLGCG